MKINLDNAIMRFGRTETGTPLVNEYFGSNKWINFGVNNDFPQEIIRLYQNASILHSTLIDRKVDMIAGSGFENKIPFIDNEYSREDLNKIVRKIAYDVVLFSGYYLNIIWSTDGKTISQIEHLPYQKMRVAKYDCDSKNNSNQLEGYYFSKDWLRYRRSENTPLFIPDFYQNFNELGITNEEFNIQYPSQVMFIREYSPDLDYYTLPSYNSALNALKLDYEISTYHLKNVQNGLMPGMIIVNKSGIPTAEEREQIYSETKRRLSGADNAGDFIMVYAESAERAPEFIPVQLNSSDQRFKDLREQLDSQIMIAHKFTNAIAGIETAGKLGNSQEITEQLQYIQNTVITPLQKGIESTFNEIAKINGVTEEIKLVKYKIFDTETVQTSMEQDKEITKIKIV